jgi:hypothetical protein
MLRENTIKRPFKIGKDESMLTLLLCLHAFFNGISIIFFETISSAYFLEQHSISTLPHTYITSSFLCITIGIIYSIYSKDKNPFLLAKIILIIIFLLWEFFI